MSSVSEKTRRNSGALTARWLVVGLLAVIAVTLLIQVGEGDAAADRAPLAAGSASSDSLLVVAGQVTRDSYGLYLVDQENRTICVYQWMATSRKLRLLAARTYSIDVKLDQYNTEPDPMEIKKLVDQARRLDPAAPTGP